MRDSNLPDPEALLANPDLFPITKGGQEHIVYAILTNMLAALYSSSGLSMSVRSKRWLAAWEVIYRAAKIGPDVVFPFVKPMLQIWPDRRINPPKAVAEMIVKFGREIEALPQEVK